METQQKLNKIYIDMVLEKYFNMREIISKKGRRLMILKKKNLQIFVKDFVLEYMKIVWQLYTMCMG